MDTFEIHQSRSDEEEGQGNLSLKKNFVVCLYSYDEEAMTKRKEKKKHLPAGRLSFGQEEFRHMSLQLR